MNDHTSSIVILTGAGASKPLGLPVMSEFLDDKFWDRGDSWFRAAAYLGYQWARANTGVADFEYIYTLQHTLSTMTIDEPLAFGLTHQAPTQLSLPGGATISLEIEPLRKGASAVLEHLRDHVHNTLEAFDQTKASSLYGRFLQPIIEQLPTPPELSLFTTNYDRTIESIWQQGDHAAAFGRPIVLRRGFVIKDPYQPGLSWDATDFDKPSDTDDGLLRLFKLHGSLHWRFTGDGVVETEANEYARDRSAIIYPLKDAKTDLQEPFATLFRFWRTSIASCTDCVVVGSSLRDPHLLEPIKQAFNQNPHLKVWLIDPQADELKDSRFGDVGHRVIAVNAQFGSKDLGAFVADYLFDPNKRDGARRLDYSGPQPPKRRKHTKPSKR